MRLLRQFARVLLGAALLAAVVVPAASVAPFSVAVVQAAGLGAGGEYHNLEPRRIYDSRDPAYTPFGLRGATPSRPTFVIPVLGRGGVPDRPGDVLAVVMNITVTEPTAEGWLDAYGTGAQRSSDLTSIVNFRERQTVPNLSIARPGADGTITIELFTPQPTGKAHVVIDVFGWFSTSANGDRGSRLVPVSPGRLIDTRDTASPILQGAVLEVPVRGATLANGVTIPNDTNVTGVVLNLTGVNDLKASSETFVSVVPEPIAAGVSPGTSNLNLARNQVKANMVIVPIGADGQIRLFNLAGQTHVVVDVAGYMRDGDDVVTTTGRVVPLTAPYRVFDTRQPAWGSLALGPNQFEDWSFADFAASVTVGRVPVGRQLAVIGNLTSAGLVREVPSVPTGSFLTVYSSDVLEVPRASNVNMVDGPNAVPNMAILTYSSQTTVRVYNFAGFSHYLFDASAIVLA
jgi:hypothetical protein